MLSVAWTGLSHASHSQRIRLELLSRQNQTGDKLRERYHKEIRGLSLKHWTADFVYGDEGGTPLERSTLAAKFIESSATKVARRMCGVVNICPRYSRPGYTKRVARIRKARQRMSKENKTGRNAMRHKIERELESGIRGSVTKRINRCRKKMRAGDPIVIWKLIDVVCMNSTKSNIPYVVVNGVRKFTDREVVEEMCT